VSASIRTVSGGITAPQGFRASGIACGIKHTEDPDLALIVSEAPAAAVGMFTRNRTVAAPVVWTRRILPAPALRAVIVNSGNANACTGRTGLQHAEAMAAHTANQLSARKRDVAVASTGVIGVPLPVDTLLPAIPRLIQGLSRSGGTRAARAILTTDTRTKIRAVELMLLGKRVRIGGIAKGSGMIHPNMATMLAFLTTDAAVEPVLLKETLKEAVEQSFNRITVDGETSTNDMALVLANGLSGVRLGARDRRISGFQEGLNRICRHLAFDIVRDGEGATKFVTVRVIGGKSEDHCLAVARRIAQSNLVKTALFGEDANWGRIMAAAGISGIPLQPGKIDIFFDKVQLVKQGAAVGASEEHQAARVLKKKNITITVDLHQGSAAAEVYTTDLSLDYVRINADYRS
jgi:glutamate N-acetyltransferase/amino-acid N-acetyltransferase